MTKRISGNCRKESTSSLAWTAIRIEIHAQVDQVRYAAVVKQSVVTYPVILKVDNPDLKLRPGMTANVTIVTAQREDVLRIPAAALRFRPPDYKAPERTARADNTARADTTRGQRRQRAGGDSTQAANGSTPRAAKPITVFVETGEEAQPRSIRTGLNDGTFVEVTGGDVALGDSVIVGMAGSSASAQRGQTLPPGMGGGGRR